MRAVESTKKSDTFIAANKSYVVAPSLEDDAKAIYFDESTPANSELQEKEPE
ncbi:hypothetical protein KUC3_27100 [Alteromonas sp. KC3]|nr:hypothetical protein KUC3_27100 [Alteromonas sp. KC3]BCO23818.1 hypothetical protein KUC14_26870 [Alteromonas sp. KC14]